MVRRARGVVHRAGQPGELLCGAGRALLHRRGRREQRGRRDLLDVPPGDHRISVPREDHLTLLGELEAPAHRTGSLREHRPVGRSAATAEGAAPPVEQGQPDRVPVGPRGDPRLRVVQREGRRERPGVLGGVGVAQHHLVPPAGVFQPSRHRGHPEHVVEHPDCAAQVVLGLEQRHHVEGERPPTEGPLGKLVHRGDVLARLRERHDVAPARVRAEPLLDLGHHPEDREHLLGLRRQVATTAREGPQLRERPRVHLGVLADLQLGQVEPERLDLPDQVLQLAVGLPAGTGRGQRDLNRAQLGQQLVRARVGDRRRCAGGSPPAWRAARSSTWRCGSPGDRVAASSARSGNAALASASSRRTAGPGGVVSASAVRARPTRSQTRSRARRTWSAWMPMAFSVNAAVTNGLPSRSPPIHEPSRTNAGTFGGCVPAVLARELVVELAVGERQHPKQRVVENRHRGTNLVEWTRLGGPDLRGTPEQVDLLQQPAPVLGPVAGTSPGPDPPVRRAARRSAGSRRQPPGGEPRSGARSGPGGTPAPAGASSPAPRRTAHSPPRRPRPASHGSAGHRCRTPEVRGPGGIPRQDW